LKNFEKVSSSIAKIIFTDIVYENKKCKSVGEKAALSVKKLEEKCWRNWPPSGYPSKKNGIIKEQFEYIPHFVLVY